ncbi:MAG: DUF2157 domain-containing protein [Gemmatimonadetes bacterium]|nr:DUF2157 domain-containing protein [Gemmatimonadota bacterium]
MLGDGRAEARALERWLREGLIDEALAGRLRAESAECAELQRRRFAQGAIALAAAAVLLLGAGTFVNAIWPELSVRVRCVLIATLGVALVAAGMLLEARERWRRIGYAFQVAGLGALLIAVGYSEQAWPAGSTLAVVAGSTALATPGVVLAIVLRRSAVMPAIMLAATYPFVAVGVARVASLSGDTVIWIADGVFGLTALALAILLARSRAGVSQPWLLPAVAVQLYAALFLVGATALEALELDERGAYLLDAWLVAVTALAWWGLHGAPPALRRPWYAAQLTLSVLLGIWLGFWTLSGPLGAGPTATAAVVAMLGVLGLGHGVPRGMPELMAASCLAIVSAAWYYAFERAQLLGTVLALLVTAAALFWLAGRIMRRDRLPSRLQAP